MRDLTRKQKNFLDKWFEENKADLRGFDLVDYLTLEEMEALEKMNDTEVLWQKTNGYLCDKLHSKNPES
jgi:hypothetical protein